MCLSLLRSQTLCYKFSFPSNMCKCGGCSINFITLVTRELCSKMTLGCTLQPAPMRRLEKLPNNIPQPVVPCPTLLRLYPFQFIAEIFNF